MTFVHASGTARNLIGAIPTVNEESKVKHWEIEIEYRCGEIKRKFKEFVDVEPFKKPEEHTKDELLNLCNIQQYDRVFENICKCVKNLQTENKLKDFDISSLKKN